MTSLPADVPTEQFIAGTWTGGSRGSFDVVDPSAGNLLTGVPRAGLDDLDRAITAAYDAQPEWAASAPRARGEVLRAAFELMVARREEIAFLISLEMGKPRAVALLLHPGTFPPPWPPAKSHRLSPPGAPSSSSQPKTHHSTLRLVQRRDKGDQLNGIGLRLPMPVVCRRWRTIFCPRGLVRRCRVPVFVGTGCRP